MLKFDIEPVEVLPLSYESGFSLMGKKMRIDVNSDFNSMTFILESEIQKFDYSKINYSYNILVLILGDDKTLQLAPSSTSAFYLQNNQYQYIYVDTSLYQNFMSLLINRHE